MERPRREENLNVLTHAVGTLLSMIAAWLLVQESARSADPWLIAACLLYGVSLVGVFLSSTLSHLASTPRWRQRFRQLDQAFIYLLIVATYTPFSMQYLQGRFWTILLSVMWLVALIGFVSKLWVAHRVDSVSVLGYVVLGWMPALGGPSLFAGLVPAAVWGIVAGGVCYTLGTVFLLNDRRVWYFHAIWHLLVIAGAAIHWWTTMRFVL
jgi:hemolysin III